MVKFRVKKEKFFSIGNFSGPSEFVPCWGATCVGARKFLIAYNVNILGTKEQAHRIALNVREQGRGNNEVNKTASVILRALFYFVDLAWQIEMCSRSWLVV